MLSKKKEDLEAIADLLYEWCVEYNEPYVSAWARYGTDRNSAIVLLDRTSPDYDVIDIYKNYDTPAGGAARVSR